MSDEITAAVVLVIIVGLVGGAWWYSGHEYDAGKAYQLAADQAASASVITEAKKEQSDADQNVMNALQAAVKQANEDAQQHATDVHNAQLTIASLKSRIAIYAKTPADKLWLGGSIPTDIVSGLCLAAQDGSYSANCQNTNSPVPAHPGG